MFTYIKYIVYGLIALMITTGAIFIHNTIKENAVYEHNISILTEQNAFKDETIKNLSKDIELRDKLVQERDSEIDNLEGKLSTVLENLPDDADLEASATLKAIIERLKDENK